MNNKWIYIISLTVLMGMAIGCSDSTTEEGSGLPNEGFIKGTVTTTRYDGHPLVFSFDHPLVDYPAEFYPEDGYQRIRIYHAKDFEGDWTGDNDSRLYFYLDSLDQDTVTFNNFRLNAIVPVQGDTVVAWGTNISTTNGRILTYHFNASDNTVSGTYTASGSGYNGQPCIVNGSFKAGVRIIIDNSNL